MADIHYLKDEVAVVGWACRFPGANSPEEFWNLLTEGRCSVTQVPPDRFSLERFGHPRRQEPGRSYSWAAGVLDNVWQFDPSVFGISPREAVQMDPQQRLLLQLTWEALEDAGIPPSVMAGADAGVYVGASQIDYAHSFVGDQSIADSHFATGTALAILANRISYIFDLRGPSVTIDTACSSSLVALHQAVEALRSGRIDTAIVGGTNVITSPSSFIAFSQASMLSPSGLCRAFAAEADGFVRAEGGGVVVLRRVSQAQKNRNPIHGLVLATDVNSDGRTGGISLPSLEAQEALLKRIYSRPEIDPKRLAFVEAHGTGTSAGDPIEAAALGRGLGVRRDAPLPIGSAKTNIGHLEPGAGIAGLIKALLALNHGVLPPSLHAANLNPNIPFDSLNLTVCDKLLPLPDAAEQIAGVNSFGFGGTNAHAVVSVGPSSPSSAKNPSSQSTNSGTAQTDFFAVSAETEPALVQLAELHARRTARLSDKDTSKVAAALAHRRDHLSHRLVVSSSRSEEVVQALRAYAAGTDDPLLTYGHVAGRDLPVALVYSGNGSQWAGMGLVAYRNSAAFRAHIALIDTHFRPLSGWSIRDMLFSEDLAEKLALTSVAQPLIFAVQSAATAALRQRGIVPVAVLGHSVGEIAAAEAAGALDLPSAVNLVFLRSKFQERVHGVGRMGALRFGGGTIDELLSSDSGLEIAAFNSPRSVTIAGAADRLAAFATAHPGIPMVDLDLDYPFHTALLEPIRPALVESLSGLVPRKSEIAFVSTVTGRCEAGDTLDGDYWWRNVRKPVQFMQALRKVAELGARFFIEVGARPTLVRHITDTLDGEVTGFAVQAVLDRKDPETDPFAKAAARAFVAGAKIDLEAVLGPNPGASVKLPTYPWQQRDFRFEHTVEAVAAETHRHPFAGARLSGDGLEWRGNIDTVLHPALQDHRVGEQVWFPGTALLEVALFVAREWLKSDNLTIANFEILKALDLTKGETREVMTRVSPGSNTVEIFSRARLSHAAWLLHCRGKMLHGHPAAGPISPRRGPTARVMTQGEVYRVAGDTGLNYGPEFRLVERMLVYPDNVIDVQLAPTSAQTNAFVLDPVRTDCCSHGTFAVFPELKAKERGVTYVPVRIDRASVYRAHLAPARALVEILSKNNRAIFANYTIQSDDGEIIASLTGVRCQAIPVRHVANVETVAVIERPRLIDGEASGTTGVDVSVATVMEASRARSASSMIAGQDLREGWALAVAYEIARGLSDNGTLDIGALVTASRLPPELQPWLANILSSLDKAGLAAERHGEWTVKSNVEMPASALLVKNIVTEEYDSGSEVLLAGALTGYAARIASDAAVKVSADTIVTPSTLDFYRAANPVSATTTDALLKLVQDIPDFWPKRRALRILQLGYGPLTFALRARSLAHPLELSVFEPERLSFDRAQAQFGKDPSIKLLDEDALDKLGVYDLIISADALHRMPSSLGLERLRGALAHGGLLVAAEVEQSLFRDLVFGLDPAWFTVGAPDRPSGRLRSAAAWRREFDAAGFGQTASSARQEDGISLIVASAPVEVQASSNEKAERSTALVVPDVQRTSPLVRGIVAEFSASGRDLVVLSENDPVPETVLAVIYVPAAVLKSDSTNAVMQRCLDLRTFAAGLAGRKMQVWLLFRAALGSGKKVSQPVETAAWAFSRTLANEFVSLDVRRIDMADGMAPVETAKMIAAAVDGTTPETELLVTASGVQAVRVEPLASVIDRLGRAAPAAARLQRRNSGGQRIEWESVARTRPAADEIEIGVEATGLNFRDLMWMLALLPDDMLEDGFTGPALGLECAGRVLRVGAAVTDYKPGDLVVALAASAFATHVTVPASRVARVPDGISAEAAATIPVAFLTAYYSLITLARLQPNETVLIHGGAGAVGMAAIQIAQWRGASIIATAGSPAKRGLLEALGVDVVLDSRSTSFVEDVAAITETGVDIVLNSLAGEAMEMSLNCLAPFGRFVELGKRDYMSNTHIGLRPFRRNLSYFGVDLDQLVVGRKSVGETLLREVMTLFEDGTLTPLPHSVFGGVNAEEAFHLMQQSSHIGKIVVRPPDVRTVRQAMPAWTPHPGHTHVITGAFGGFGTEVARWLADHGARHLVLIGRRGAHTPEARALVAELMSRGVQVLAEPCDVADLRAVESLFRKIQKTMPPVAGVMHAAMVLDDAVITNLTEDRFMRVLAPKVTGAENLDITTRGMSLDYFVLFSSVTTLIGNPGQGNYVAANAFMEGLARRRRVQGLPGLAVGWGPISDVGVVAANEKLRNSLQKLTGVRGLRARQGLDMLAQALAEPSNAIELAVMTIALNDGAFSKERLPILRSPTYTAFVRDQGAAEAASDGVDLRGLMKSESRDVVRRKVADVVVKNLAKVLHARAEDISRVRPLGEIGLDSLMTLELVMDLESAFGFNISLVNSVGALSVPALADEIIAQVDGSRDREDTALADIAGRHVAALAPEQVDVLKTVAAPPRRAEGAAP